MYIYIFRRRNILLTCFGLTKNTHAAPAAVRPHVNRVLNRDWRTGFTSAIIFTSILRPVNRSHFLPILTTVNFAKAFGNYNFAHLNNIRKQCNHLSSSHVDALHFSTLFLSFNENKSRKEREIYCDNAAPCRRTAKKQRNNNKGKTTNYNELSKTTQEKKKEKKVTLTASTPDLAKVDDRSEEASTSENKEGKLQLCKWTAAVHKKEKRKKTKKKGAFYSRKGLLAICVSCIIIIIIRNSQLAVRTAVTVNRVASFVWWDQTTNSNQLFRGLLLCVCVSWMDNSSPIERGRDTQAAYWTLLKDGNISL